MATLKLCDIRKSYGSVEVIKGVVIDVEDGELAVVVGPSGCGKSTLLRMGVANPGDFSTYDRP